MINQPVIQNEVKPPWERATPNVASNWVHNHGPVVGWIAKAHRHYIEVSPPPLPTETEELTLGRMNWDAVVGVFEVNLGEETSGEQRAIVRRMLVKKYERLMTYSLVLVWAKISRAAPPDFGTMPRGSTWRGRRLQGQEINEASFIADKVPVKRSSHWRADGRFRRPRNEGAKSSSLM